MPDTQINPSSRCGLSIITFQGTIEKGMPLSFAITFDRFADVRDALKLKECLATFFCLRVRKSSKTLDIPKIKLYLKYRCDNIQ